MNVRIVYLLSFGFGLFGAVILVYVYSVCVNSKDDKLKDMLRRVAGANGDKQDLNCFVLEKIVIFIFTAFFMGFFAVCFFGSILFKNIGTAKYCLTVFVCILFAIGCLSSFADYFLSMVVVVDDLIYVRCMKTWFRPVVVIFDGSQAYERIGTEVSSFLVARYMVCIRINNKLFVVMNARNKKHLIKVFNNMKEVRGTAV
ncbi:hypothetical protein GTA51_03695 [Desulfovibrio aerotolerans]|uniref:Uncharacterized protein n=1 Tax=Solidesulfovibrio aerotolerans TaxID=295255 RepID=A0A7C9ITC7_9BACT|nr:hypothetical protein [Solidesulfovibrio aerotolerans]MYL82240.1 hypothetical protein [Solidesulfovibrio aerotolerans]